MSNVKCVEDEAAKGRQISKVEGLRCILYNIMVWSDRECSLSLHKVQYRML
jgi:hypothetical protein